LPPAPVRVSRVACCAEDVLLPPKQLHNHDLQDRCRFGLDFFLSNFLWKKSYKSSRLLFLFVGFAKRFFRLGLSVNFVLSFVLQIVISLRPSNLVCQGFRAPILQFCLYFIFFGGVGGAICE
jgi:hypothetical protein